MNNRQRFARYMPNDFDQFDCVKISKFFYLFLVFILRGYIVWIMSVTNFNDRVGVIEWVYPDPILFYTSLLSGVVGLFVVLIMSLRRPDAQSWVKKCWQNIRAFLAVALCFDWIIILGAYFYGILYELPVIIIHGVFVMIAIVILYSNKRIQINIEEFPEKLPD
ncbi:DUF2919 family protein [Thalassotalea profundi]|uniref:DUF2919 domain-containing protein n=1 Tax=Thalassotalea profundi TaxID=2036687 RepID=A0ABQ3J6D7_9GAMM|nr:DUF2919 family protein [Thalassotalea profundi]GHF01808.1 hypothetical protein GCM10011501_34000 [Thalassotalea profundi]